MCAAVLKNWREAATLILAHCRKNPVFKELHPSTVVATEDLQPTKPAKEDLEVLFLKRSSKSSFMPDLYVFPGGIADNADFSRSWLPMFGATSPDLADKRFGFSKTVSPHAPMFHRKRDPDFTAIPGEVAFRISAIRETFEESGVLLVRNINQTSFENNPNLTSAFSFGDNHASMMEEWRERVMRNPAEFQTLCKDLDVVPDIWSLYDWSNWLTPHSGGIQPGDKRFDAAFFICCLKEEPYVAEDANETVHAVWASPKKIMENYSDSKVQLAPPQLYETCRLVNFNNVEELLRFCRTRLGQPLDRWMAVRIECADAVIYTFPGDSLYPEQPDFEGEQPLLHREETLQELTRKSKQLHRAVATMQPEGSQDAHRFQLQCNIRDLPYGHVAPVLP